VTELEHPTGHSDKAAAESNHHLRQHRMVGHLIPHLSGGKFGPNIFRQDRGLNRGWSEQGKRYRALEHAAARTHGALYFGHLLYVDDTTFPMQIEIAVLLPGATLRVEQFDNRPGEQA
jgi:hypothetical protein